MMTERRYDDDEVAAIFRTATEGVESRSVPVDHADGLTLRDLQSIAGEVGISPIAVAQAARSLDRPSATAGAQTFLGLPIAVERTVALDRRLTEPEWERLVVELRQVFRARGSVRVQGSLREWSNGNLHALIEPTATGYQLRLATLKSGARASVVVGPLTLGLSVVIGVLVASNGTLAQAAPAIAALGIVGAALIANGALRLPSWARRRRRQMDDIAEWLTAATQDDHAELPRGLEN
jgi:hypothetical protein